MINFNKINQNLGMKGTLFFVFRTPPEKGGYPEKSEKGLPGDFFDPPRGGGHGLAFQKECSPETLGI